MFVHRCRPQLSCALVVLAILLPVAAGSARAAEGPISLAASSRWFDNEADVLADIVAAQEVSEQQVWVIPSDELPAPHHQQGYEQDYGGGGQPAYEGDGFSPRPSGWNSFADDYPCKEWGWQILPTGLIYRSYLAGAHEPRMSIVAMFDDGRALWDATLGGRAGIIRYGNNDPCQPQGIQLDVYGAAVVRLDVDNRQDLESTDYVFGFPVTYGVGRWQFKFGYAHLSSHLGDERAIRVPGTLAERINYVRDGLVFGTSYYAHPMWRLYGEVGWAFHTSGGARSLEQQFGTELSQPGPTGPGGTPFLALNARLREEHNFGGDFASQAGWLWRGETGHTMRFGAHYYNGKSSQFQFFNTSEEQIGIGLWYDF